MFRSVAMVLSTLHFCISMAAAQSPDKARESKAAKLAAEAKAIADDLKEARELVKKVNDKALREKLELLISRSELRVTAIKTEIESLTPSAAAAMADGDFQKLLKSIKEAAFDKDKLAIVTALKGVRISSDQLKAIMKEFSFDDGRISAGLQLYPLLTDPGMIFKVFETFTFDSKKSQFRDALEKQKK